VVDWVRVLQQEVRKGGGGGKLRMSSFNAGIDHSALILGTAAAGNGARTEIHHSVKSLTVGVQHV